MKQQSESIQHHTTKTIPLISQRECSVLKLIAAGLTSEEISAVLFITTETVKSHRKNITVKLRANNTASMIRAAFDHKLLIPHS